jgi:hypothetical protein
LWKKTILLLKKTILCDKKDYTLWQKRLYFLWKKTILFVKKDYTFVKKDYTLWQKKTLFFVKKDYTFCEKRLSFLLNKTKQMFTPFSYFTYVTIRLDALILDQISYTGQHPSLESNIWPNPKFYSPYFSKHLVSTYFKPTRDFLKYAHILFTKPRNLNIGSFWNFYYKYNRKSRKCRYYSIKIWYFLTFFYTQ